MKEPPQVVANSRQLPGQRDANRYPSLSYPPRRAPMDADNVDPEGITDR